MSPSVEKSNLTILAWIWEACVTLDFKEVYKIEREIQDVESLRKYFMDDRNTSLLLSIRKLENILENLIWGKECDKVLEKFQNLTIELLKDTNLHTSSGIVQNLICFHHYCVLIIYEKERNYKRDILLPSLPVNSEDWDKIKDYFKFEDETYKVDVIQTLEEFYNCKRGMSERETSVSRYSDFLRKVEFKLHEFCIELRSLLLTPTLVKVSENDVEYIFYKHLDLPKCSLIMEHIKTHGVTQDSINDVFDLLLPETSLMDSINSEELSPVIELDSNIARAYKKNKNISTDTIVSGTTSSSTITPYSILRFTSFLKTPEDSSVQNPSSIVTEQSGAIGDITVVSDADLVSESLGARETESQIDDGTEPISKSAGASNTLVQVEDQEILHSGISVLGSLLIDARKVSETLGSLKFAATRVVNACSEFERTYSEFNEAISCPSNDKVKALLQYLKMENVCKEAENLCNVNKFCESNTTLMDTSIQYESSKGRQDISDAAISVDSELSMPILTPEAPLEIEGNSGNTFDNSLTSLTPMKDSTSSAALVTPQIGLSTDSIPQSESSKKDTCEKSISYEQSPPLNENNNKQDTDTSAHLSRLSKFSDDASFENSVSNSETDVNESPRLRITSFSPQTSPLSKFSDNKAVQKTPESSSDKNEDNEQQSNTISYSDNKAVEKSLSESSSPTNKNGEYQTDTSNSYYTPQNEFSNDGVGEEEVQSFGRSGHSLQTGSFQDELERSEKCSEASEDEGDTFSPYSVSQNVSYKGEANEKDVLNESNSSKDKSIEQQAPNTSLQESPKSNNNDTSQLDATEEANSPSDTKLKSNPCVVVTPLRNFTQHSNTPKSLDQEGVLPVVLEEEFLNSPDEDEGEENSQIVLNTSSNKSPKKDFRPRGLCKRRRIEVDSSYSEEEV